MKTNVYDNTHDCPDKQGRRSDGSVMRSPSRRLSATRNLPPRERTGESSRRALSSDKNI